jgi:hypothetical protein
MTIHSGKISLNKISRSVLVRKYRKFTRTDLLIRLRNLRSTGANKDLHLIGVSERLSNISV